MYEQLRHKAGHSPMNASLRTGVALFHEDHPRCGDSTTEEVAP